MAFYKKNQSGDKPEIEPRTERMSFIIKVATFDFWLVSQNIFREDARNENAETLVNFVKTEHFDFFY